MKRLLPVADALERVLAAARPVSSALSLPLIDALGCVAFADIVSSIDVPSCDNSAMDGYALCAAEAHLALPVSQRIPAGTDGSPLAAQTAARIFTGAPIPPGADAVAMQEACREADGVVTVRGNVTAGLNIRPRGQDIRAGEIVIPKGRVLRPQDLGLLASIGCATVQVFRPLRVALLSTGNELAEPGSGELPRGGVFNSNRYTLGGLLRALHLECIDCGIVADTPAATAQALQWAAAHADCVITSGGVSVGEADHVKAQVEQLGRLDMWKLAIKPGKPLAFGAIGETPFIGLPGNPASVFVTFCLIARPFLLKMQGATEHAPLRLRAHADFAVRKPGDRQEYLRVTVAATMQGLRATPYPEQSSGALSSVSHSNALAVIPVGAAVEPGDLVDVLLLDLLAC